LANVVVLNDITEALLVLLLVPILRNCFAGALENPKCSPAT